MNVMNFKHRLIWQDFLELESELGEILKFIPYEADNLTTFSPKCSELLLSTCSKMESFMKYSLDSSLFDLIYLLGFHDIKKFLDTNVKNQRDLNIKIYRKIFDEIYHLSSKSVIFKGHRFIAISPFKTWKENGTLPWWNTYNKLKHNYFEFIESGTLEKAVISLAGYFLIIFNHIESLNWLLHHTNAIKCDKPKEKIFRELETPEVVLNEWDQKRELYTKASEDNPDNKYLQMKSSRYKSDTERNRRVFNNMKEWSQLLQPFKTPLLMTGESHFFTYIYQSPITCD